MNEKLRDRAREVMLLEIHRTAQAFVNHGEPRDPFLIAFVESVRDWADLESGDEAGLPRTEPERRAAPRMDTSGTPAVRPDARPHPHGSRS